MSENIFAEKINKKNRKKSVAILVLSAVALLIVGGILFFAAGYAPLHPDRVAVRYVDTIVQTADGYSAHKYTLAGKNMKHSDFIRENYINPVVYRDTDYVIGDSTDGFKGYNDESFLGEKALSDDGRLMRHLINGMYEHYVELVQSCGWDDYDSIYSGYMQYLVSVREEIFADKYLSDELFFTAFEANVKTYGEKLTGTEDAFDKKTGEQISKKKQGFYEEYYGEDYTLTAVRVAEPVAVDLEEYRSSADKALFEAYRINTDDISEVRVFEIAVKNQKDETVTECIVTVCKTGMLWYVDNTATDTSSLYDFFFNLD